MNNTAKLKELVFELISKNELEKAFEVCKTEFESDSPHYEAIIVISSRYYNWKRKETLGLAPPDSLLNEIRLAIIGEVKDYLIFMQNAEIEKTQKEISSELPPEQNNHSEEIIDFQKIIKKKAAEEYPNDFGMQKYTIQQQMNAFRRLQEAAPKDISITKFKRIQSKAKEEYPTDFSMQEYTQKQEIKAYRELQHQKPKDITTEAWEIIRHKASTEHPNSYNMQHYTQQKQIEAFRSLKGFRTKDIPEDVFKSIYQKAVNEHPKDYQMQVYTIRKQLESYRELNRM